MEHPSHRRRITGILLAAGKGRRFDPAGMQDKLLQRLPDGDTVVVASARRLRAVLANVIAVIRPDSPGVRRQLEELDCDVVECEAAGLGMAASLVHALRHAQDADGWVIALADMPFVSADTIAALAHALDSGAGIAVPVYRGERGNPVAFSREHFPRLLQLQGDQGARSLLKNFPVNEIDVDDAGILRDIDTVEDLLAVDPARNEA